MDFDGELAQWVQEFLADGPKKADVIIAALRASDLIDEDFDDDDLFDAAGDEIWILLDGNYDLVARLVEGRRLTHLLTDADLKSRAVPALPDFAALDLDFEVGKGEASPALVMSFGEKNETFLVDANDPSGAWLDRFVTGETWC